MSWRVPWLHFHSIQSISNRSDYLKIKSDPVISLLKTPQWHSGILRKTTNSCEVPCDLASLPSLAPSLLTPHILLASLPLLTYTKLTPPPQHFHLLPSFPGVLLLPLFKQLILLIIQVSGPASPLKGLLCQKKTIQTPTTTLPQVKTSPMKEETLLGLPQYHRK